MKNYTVVKRYAQALLDLGRADGQYEQYGRELTQLSAALAGAGEAARALISPVFPEGVRRKMLLAVLQRAALSPLVNNFVRLLLDKGHLGELADIAEAYNRMADAEKGVIQAQVTSAGPLSAAELAAIREALNRFAKRQVELTVNQDPAIIGGLVARLGDLTIDGSVRTQINKLSGLLDAL